MLKQQLRQRDWCSRQRESNMSTRELKEKTGPQGNQVRYLFKYNTEKKKKRNEYPAWNSFAMHIVIGYQLIVCNFLQLY